MKASQSHVALGPEFFDPVRAAEFPNLTLRYRNQRAAATVGLEGLSDEDWLAHFGRFEPIPGSLPEPLALRYHGHQFQNYNPDLGDGRGFLFAQLHELGTDRLLDLGTKGSGRTPWSRGADGRLTLKGGVREVLATSMLEALGVDTSKSFSLVETGEELERHDEPSPTRGAVLVRLSHSHVRIGTFQRLGFQRDSENMDRLLDYVLGIYMPGVASPGDNRRAEKFLAEVAGRVAQTAADWIVAGFVHGVLDSDNINVTGESFGYGPWRFLPTYDPSFTAAYFDQTGLYAFGRQPDAVAWNLTRLAETLLPLGEHDGIEAALNTFWPAFQRGMWSGVLRRLALLPQGDERDSELTAGIFTFLHQSQVTYEQFWFDWRGGRMSSERATRSPAAAAYDGPDFSAVRDLLFTYDANGSENLAHPYFARSQPRTMLIDEMEQLWAPIADADDWSAFHAALDEIDEMRRAYSGDRKSSGRDASIS